MFRLFVMLPAGVDHAITEDLVARAASKLESLPGYHAMTASTGALMGPSAKAGAASCVMEADFTTLDDALSALHDPGFQDVRSAIESFQPTLLLFELSRL